MDIIFTDTALDSLHDIFEFYLPQTGLIKANMIMAGHQMAGGDFVRGGKMNFTPNY